MVLIKVKILRSFVTSMKFKNFAQQTSDYLLKMAQAKTIE